MIKPYRRLKHNALSVVLTTTITSILMCAVAYRNHTLEFPYWLRYYVYIYKICTHLLYYTQ